MYICMYTYVFNLYSEYLTKEALEGFGDFKIGGQVIRYHLRDATETSNFTWHANALQIVQVCLISIKSEGPLHEDQITFSSVFLLALEECK
jgi:hypothetical protein